MIRHVELVLERLLELVGGWMCALAMVVTLALAALAFLGLNLYKFDKASFSQAFRRLNGLWARGWGWALVAAVVFLQVYSLGELRQGLQERLTQEDQARYIAADDQGGLPTTQRAPSVSFLESTVRTQRIVLPPQLQSLQAIPGWNAEEARYGGSAALNVEDELVKDDKAVVLNRKTEITRWVPTKLLRSDVDVKLDFLGRDQSRKRQAYRADFNARYTFQNPFPENRKFHFAFPLPDNSGTLAGFRFQVDGQDVPAQDVDRGLDYEMELKPAQKAVVSIAYSHQGAQAWDYDVTGRREPVGDFHLNVKVARGGEVKFLRGSLYPTQTQGDLLSWNLQNQITSQSIQLYFPFVPTEQLVRNLYIFSPLALLGLVLLIVVWARLRHTRTSPWSVALASLGSCVGYCLAAYLLSYVGLFLALVVACGVTAALQVYLLGRRLWVPVAAGTLAPFTFLAGGHTGLLLSLLALACLALTVRETVRSRDLA